jgi:hypothetical protein
MYRSGIARLFAIVIPLALFLALGFAFGSFLMSNMVLAQDEATPIPEAIPADSLTSTFGVSVTAELSPAVGLPPQATQPPDTACRLCHVGNETLLTLPSGEQIAVGIDPALLNDSVHGSHAAAPVYCTDCHAPRQRYQYPHVPTDAQNLHDFQSDIAGNCASCHTSSELHNPGHIQVEEELSPPNCVECHGGHEIEPSADMYADPTSYCQSCHPVSEMSDDQTRLAHENVMANLEEGENCESCHSDQPQTQSQQCENCHARLDATVVREDGEAIYLHVDPVDIVTSVHGKRIIGGVEYPPLDCTECHADLAEAGFPHPEELMTGSDALRTSVEQQCVECHADVAGQYADGIHAQHVAEGETNAASCADCHGSHAIDQPDVPRSQISDTCGNCHEEIYDQYKSSVHGAALYERDNPDVPVCTDCHGAHEIADPTTAAFRLSSPQMCGDCHSDEHMMGKYGISTDVFDTYVADFHGTTVTLFEHTSPNEMTNKAVCYDCHGVHDIQSVSEADPAVVQERLLATCQECHPDASENFPASWMSHYTPSLEHYPLVYLVDLFYKILIPAVMAGFMLFIGTDIYRRLTDRYIRRRNARRDKQ